MTKLNFIKTAVAGLFTAAALSTSAMAQDVTLRLHQFLPPPAPVPSCCGPFHDGCGLHTRSFPAHRSV